jgi:hypothetical protein
VASLAHDLAETTATMHGVFRGPPSALPRDCFACPPRGAPFRKRRFGFPTGFALSKRSARTKKSVHEPLEFRHFHPPGMPRLAETSPKTAMIR